MKRSTFLSVAIILTIVIVAMLLSLFAMKPSGKDRLLTEFKVKPGNNGTVLVVLLHGYTYEGKNLVSVQRTIEQIPELNGADILRPNLPLSRFSMEKPSQITSELIGAIDLAWEQSVAEGSPYQRIIIIGHSTGALFARKVYVTACGEKAEAPFEDSLKERLRFLEGTPKNIADPRNWASAVERVVLLAGINRGWSISHHMSITRGIAWQIGIAYGYILTRLHKQPPVILTVRRGAPFITQLRLQWLAMIAEAKKYDLKIAKTVQLLGTVDDLVSPDDNIDAITGKDFFYLEVPESGHNNVIEMDDDVVGLKRQKMLKIAFDDEELNQHRVEPSDSLLTIRPDVTDVVFVIHGIRDEGFWTRKIARRVQKLGKENGRKFAFITSSYGYFPMLSFLNPGARQKKVGWLMDRYVEARATYPIANFHFIGHSNGTYLFAKALLDCEAVRFNQVVFAGSVVLRDYKWIDFVNPKDRVKSVFNFVTTDDWVVATFPKILQYLKIQDLGSAGYDGFESAITLPQVKEFEERKKYVIGGHSGALKEEMWSSIANFIVTGQIPSPPESLLSEKQTSYKRYLAIIVVVLLGFLSVLIWLWKILVKYEVREWVKTVYIISITGLIWNVLTKL